MRKLLVRWNEYNLLALTGQSEPILPPMKKAWLGIFLLFMLFISATLEHMQYISNYIF